MFSYNVTQVSIQQC